LPRGKNLYAASPEPDETVAKGIFPPALEGSMKGLRAYTAFVPAAGDVPAVLAIQKKVKKRGGDMGGPCPKRGRAGLS